MFGSHRSLLARHTGPLLFLKKLNGELSVLEYFLVVVVFFFSKQLQAALILVYISSFVVSLRYVVCPRYLNSATFSFCVCC